MNNVVTYTSRLMFLDEMRKDLQSLAVDYKGAIGPFHPYGGCSPLLGSLSYQKAKETPHFPICAFPQTITSVVNISFKHSCLLKKGITI